jgi:hypothetical protein
MPSHVRLSLLVALVPLVVGACARSAGGAAAADAVVAPAEPSGTASVVEDAGAPTPAVGVVGPAGDAGEAAAILPVWSADSITLARDKDAVTGAAGAAARVIASSLFRRHLVKIAKIDPQPNATPTDGSTVANLYLGLDGVAHQYPSKYLTTTQGCTGFPLTHTGASTATTGLNGASGTATTTLHSCTLERARAYPKTDADPGGTFACAVNTLAHEWSHSIPDESRHQTVNNWLYQDTGHKHAKMGLVSYTIGAIAQCAYLDSRGFKIEERFEECVESVGTTTFNSSTCNERWAHDKFGRR